MIIHEIAMKNFMSHKSTRIKLPSTGVVAVVGGNGAGKSAMIEAVAMALWGKTLRGAKPWAAKEAFAQVHCGNVYATRQWNGARKRLFWNRSHESETKWETPTKAQNALCEIIGPFDAWKRTHVFSSQDAAHFTMATDSERKRLLEDLLGINWFDAALKLCRKDLKVAVSSLDSSTVMTQQLEEKLNMISASIDEANAMLEELGEPADASELREEFSDWRTKLRSSEDKMSTHRKQLAEWNQLIGAANADVKRLEDRMASLGDECPTCHQEISDDLKTSIESDITAAKDVASDTKSQAKEELDDVEEIITKSSKRRDTIKGKLVELRTQIKSLEAHQSQVLRQQKLASSSSCAFQKTELAFIEAEGRMMEAEKNVAELRAAEATLGLRGVRAHVLGSALRGIEGVANAWLRRICGGQMSLTLKSYREKQRGGLTDSISLQISGAGGGHGYTGASGGERRRIDVALLFALAEVASGARVPDAGTRLQEEDLGTPTESPGTLFFDEVLDALDTDGVSAVAESLQELSRVRPIVVVSHAHSERLARIATMTIRVEDGVATW